VDNLGFTQCDVDQAVFFSRSESELVVIVVHVDDCTIAMSSINGIAKVKEQMRKHIKIMDLRELHWLLGIEVSHNQDNRTLSLSQKSYFDSIIRCFNFQDLKPVSNPMEPITKLHSGQSPSTGADYAAMCHVPYHKAIGSLMYASLGTRPDISYAVAMIHIMLLKQPRAATLGCCPLYIPVPAQHNGSKIDVWRCRKCVNRVCGCGWKHGEDRCAISGYAFLINGGAISWSSKCQ
jgi:hypothetical protein